MGLAKYAEELRNNAARAAERFVEPPTNSAIIASRKLRGRVPERPGAVGATEKQARVLERLNAKQRKRYGQAQAEKKKAEDRLTKRAR